jgi:hypothetical protein
VEGMMLIYHPHPHPHDNIGMVHKNTGDYSKALPFSRSSLPSYHPNLQRQRKNFEDMKKKL